MCIRIAAARKAGRLETRMNIIYKSINKDLKTPCFQQWA